eukprot:TRINITY_DN38672_c0_g1_i1.p1 TRINITY_DN38672_c0_g1~~TRINITY_DN38672_c0_g1_i1.p1  ORF type:complete len:152 (-),score=35.56 TRINITY_DN38672_c0_g1_i1:850-1305(-)
MSSNGTTFVGGRLSLRGKALDVKDGVKKPKKKKQQGLNSQQLQALQQAQDALRREEEGGGGGAALVDGELTESGRAAGEGSDGGQGRQDQGSNEVDHRTPAEKKYHEQVERLQARKAAKTAGSSHRQRIEDFNKYLANMSEHYDIPKVGPG